MKDLIKNIIFGKKIDEIISYTLNDLYLNGPVNNNTMETLSYLKLFHPQKFSMIEQDVIELMGVFYKQASVSSLRAKIFDLYNSIIRDEYGENYTPIQADIIQKITNNQVFSFSAPTSTGKSFTFRYLLKTATNDVVVVVPSRALINEYYEKVCSIIEDKSVNILTFIEKVNVKKSTRSIFIVTPERCRDLFKHKDDFKIDLILFDEAQIGDEESTRGIYFDSIVRRVTRTFPNAKIVFAHPFINNPIAQLEKNNLIRESSNAIKYEQRNVGQIFVAHNGNNFFYFGIDKSVMGSTKTFCGIDIIEDCLKTGGSVLIYTTKASIYNKSVFNEFSHYIKMCNELQDKYAKEIIAEIKQYIGATNNENEEYHSFMIDMLSRGIVVHHGSMPLRVRQLMEKFTSMNYCKLCFATSTLEQGINMPFDVVYINTFHESEPLAIKNLIGRAGRSTQDKKFDFGYVIVKQNNMSQLRNVLMDVNEIDSISNLDKDVLDDDYRDFKKAIKEGTFSDEYNLTEQEVLRLNENQLNETIVDLISNIFHDDNFIRDEQIKRDFRIQPELYDGFIKLYQHYLNRKLELAEVDVLKTAVRIIFWKINDRTFKTICNIRYAQATRKTAQKALQQKIADETNIVMKEIYRNQLRNLRADYFVGYNDLPNKFLKRYSLLGYSLATQVDYDRIVYDTYDFLDKLIGFKLSDIFYAAFYQHYKRTQNELSLRLAKLIKYGTDNDTEIWLLKYGFEYEDIEWLVKYVDKVDEQEIVFKENVKELDEFKLSLIERYI